MTQLIVLCMKDSELGVFVSFAGWNDEGTGVGKGAGQWVRVGDVPGDGSATAVGDYTGGIGFFLQWRSEMQCLRVETREGTYRFYMSPAGGLVPRIEGGQTVWPSFEELGLEMDRTFWEVQHVLPDGSLHPMVYVPPSPPEGYLAGEKPGVLHHLPGFFADKYNVTVDEWNRFARHTGQEGRLKPVTAQRKAGEISVLDHPVTNVSWDEACEWARWAGLRLPSEVEWEYACRGTDSRTYAWGNEPPDDERCWTGIITTKEGTAPVTQCPKGVSPFGLWDMIGNVWKWMADKW